MRPGSTDPVSWKVGLLGAAIVLPLAMAVPAPWTRPAIGAGVCAFVAGYLWRRYPLPKGSPLTVGQGFQRYGALLGRAVAIILPLWIACALVLPLGLNSDQTFGLSLVGSIALVTVLAVVAYKFRPRCPRCHTDFRADRKAAIVAGADRMKPVQDLWQSCPHCSLPFDQPFRQTA